MATQMCDKHRTIIRKADTYDDLLSDDEIYLSKESALITVTMIMSSNPHSNPFNTTGYSTMGYWNQVKQEIENL